MNKISVCLKSVICALVCISMSLSIILINTSKLLGYSDSTMFILGGVCGIIIAVITKGDTLKKNDTSKIRGNLFCCYSPTGTVYFICPILHSKVNIWKT